MQPVCTAVSTLATRAQAWKAIPGVSAWVMNTVRQGYSLQFARRPPRFRGVLATSVRSDDAHVLRAVVMNLLEKGAIEIVPPAQSESGFYSHYFLVPKKDSGLRPILDLRLLKSHPDEKIVQYDHFETDPLANMPRGLVCVAGSERRLFSHPDSPHHRLFLRFAFERVAYQYQVLPFGLSLAPRTFTRCMDAAGNPHTPLPRQLAHFGPVAGSFDIAQDPPPQPLRLPGAQGQLCQERTVTQPTGIVPGYSYRLGADDSYGLIRASHLDSASHDFLQGRQRPSAQSFSEDAGPYGSSFTGTSAGSASYATHPFLVERGFQQQLGITDTTA